MAHKKKAECTLEEWQEILARKRRYAAAPSQRQRVKAYFAARHESILQDPTRRQAELMKNRASCKKYREEHPDRVVLRHAADAVRRANRRAAMGEEAWEARAKVIGTRTVASMPPYYVSRAHSIPRDLLREHPELLEVCRGIIRTRRTLRERFKKEQDNS